MRNPFRKRWEVVPHDPYGRQDGIHNQFVTHWSAKNFANMCIARTYGRIQWKVERLP